MMLNFIWKSLKATFKLMVVMCCIAQFLGIMALPSHLLWFAWGIAVIPYGIFAGAVWGFRVIDRNDEYALPWTVLFFAWGMPMLPFVLMWYEDFSKFFGLPTISTGLPQWRTFLFATVFLVLNVTTTILANKIAKWFFSRLNHMTEWVMEPAQNKGG